MGISFFAYTEGLGQKQFCGFLIKEDRDCGEGWRHLFGRAAIGREISEQGIVDCCEGRSLFRAILAAITQVLTPGAGKMRQ